MSQISKCPKITVVLSYWEALGEVSELSYKSLLYSTSIGSYCSRSDNERMRLDPVSLADKSDYFFARIMPGEYDIFSFHFHKK